MVILELIHFVAISALVVIPLSVLCFVIYKSHICHNHPNNVITPILMFMAQCCMTLFRLCKRDNSENAEVSV